MRAEGRSVFRPFYGRLRTRFSEWLRVETGNIPPGQNAVHSRAVPTEIFRNLTNATEKLAYNSAHRA